MCCIYPSAFAPRKLRLRLLAGRTDTDFVGRWGHGYGAEAADVGGVFPPHLGLKHHAPRRRSGAGVLAPSCRLFSSLHSTQRGGGRCGAPRRAPPESTCANWSLRAVHAGKGRGLRLPSRESTVVSRTRSVQRMVRTAWRCLPCVIQRSMILSREKYNPNPPWSYSGNEKLLHAPAASEPGQIPKQMHGG